MPDPPLPKLLLGRSLCWTEDTGAREEKEQNHRARKGEQGAQKQDKGARVKVYCPDNCLYSKEQMKSQVQTELQKLQRGLWRELRGRLWRWLQWGSIWEQLQPSLPGAESHRQPKEEEVVDAPHYAIFHDQGWCKLGT